MAPANALYPTTKTFDPLHYQMRTPIFLKKIHNDESSSADHLSHVV